MLNACKKVLLALSALVLSAGAAHAQATRTWVSGVGDDANPCSRTAPCKTFAGAISKTATGGEINCLDAGGFGGVTITKSISIICQVEAGVLVSGTNAIVVNATSTSEVLLEGLDIEGLGTGLNGVNVLNAGIVTIRKSSIRNFTQYGVRVASSTIGTRVIIDQTMIIGSATGGLLVQGAGGVTNNAFVYDSLFDNNGGGSLTIAGPGNLIVSRSTLMGGAAFTISGGGAITSYGDNVVRGTGSPTAIVPRS